MAERPVQLERRDGTARFEIVGELDAAASGSLQRALQQAVGSVDGRIELDLSAVEFIDSSCVEVLLTAQQDLRERGVVLSIGAVSDDVRMVLELADVDRRLGLHSRGDLHGTGA